MCLKERLSGKSHPMLVKRRVDGKAEKIRLRFSFFYRRGFCFRILCGDVCGLCFGSAKLVLLWGLVDG